MNPRSTLAAALALPALLLPATAASAAPPADRGAEARGAGASQGTQVYRAHLNELNDSGATGRALLLLRGNELTVHIKARGLLPNAPHAQHIHGEGQSVCPPMSAAGDDGVLTVVEGAVFYGGIVASLTVTNGTSPAQALDLEIMPVADDQGRIDYRRTFTLPDDVAEDLEDYQIVQHGVDLDGSGAYDGDRESSVAPGVPLEVTAPANCGTIERVSQGR